MQNSINRFDIPRLGADPDSSVYVKLVIPRASNYPVNILPG
jgi:hypothetical protein